MTAARLLQRPSGRRGARVGTNAFSAADAGRGVRRQRMSTTSTSNTSVARGGIGPLPCTP